jgi:hypothetical protein
MHHFSGGSATSGPPRVPLPGCPALMRHRPLCQKVWFSAGVTCPGGVPVRAYSAQRVVPKYRSPASRKIVTMPHSEIYRARSRAACTVTPADGRRGYMPDLTTRRRPRNGWGTCEQLDRDGVERLVMSGADTASIRRRPRSRPCAAGAGRRRPHEGRSAHEGAGLHGGWPAQRQTVFALQA